MSTLFALLLPLVSLSAVPAEQGAPVTFAQEARADSLPVVTLREALRRATNLDPNYVAALGRIDNAGWARTAAITAFVVPSVTLSASGQRFTSEFFNIGTAQLTSQLFQGSASASLNLFRGDKFFELDRTEAELEASRASELQALYETAVQTESDYYTVLAGKELQNVARERVRRATEQLAVARARVVSGAAVQTDSLQLVLELTRARVELLLQEAELRVARFQLARRVGAAGPVDAAALDTAAAPALPLSEAAAIAEALAEGPEYKVVLADEEAAYAAMWGARSQYLPTIDLFGSYSAFDDRFFPTATSRGALGLSLSWPLWNGGQREIQMTRTRVEHDVAQARRADTELAIRRDVAQAYAAYNTARASAMLAAEAVIVARASLRVQESRYRSGATTILDLLTAQVDLTDAEAGLVQSRYATRLALAGLEALLGRRLFADRIEP
jgi:outer membrane protein